MTAQTLTPLGAGPRVRRLTAIASTALRQALAERGAVLGRVAFYAILLLVFSRLWIVVTEKGAVDGLGAADLLWYLAITEWITLSLPSVHLEIEAEVRSGDVSLQLARPLSYVSAKIASGLGEFLARAATLLPAGALLATLLVGGLPGDPRGLLFVIPLGLLSGLCGVLLITWIGLSGFWLQDVSPAYWVWQKLAFVFGGLLFPISIYPAWLQSVAAATPFSWQLYGPGRMAFGFDPGGALAVAIALVLWNLVIGLGVHLTYRRALRVIDVNGG